MSVHSALLPNTSNYRQPWFTIFISVLLLLICSVFMKRPKYKRKGVVCRLYTLQSSPDMNRPLLKMAIWGSTLLQPQKSSLLGVLLYETWAHMGLRWAFVESLESSKI